MENYIIRSKARKQLKEKMGLAVSTILLSTLLLNIINVTLDISEDNLMIFSLFFCVGYLFISAPIQAGRCKFLLNMVQNNEEAKVTDLFSQFNIFIKVFFMGIIMFVIQSIIIIIPIELIFMKIGISSIYSLSVNVLYESLVLILITSIVIMIILFFIQIVYSQVNFIMVENPNMKVIECMRKSRQIMKGHKFKFLKLQLSFIGWWLLSGLTLGILALWVNPYSMLANANFYEEIKDKTI